MANLNKKIVSALSSFKLPIAETIYEGSASSYFVYSITYDVAGDTGDDAPQAYVATVQIHYVCLLHQSYASMKKQIRQALVSAGFTPPEVTDMSDEKEKLRRLVFECEIINEYDLESEEQING